MDEREIPSPPGESQGQLGPGSCFFIESSTPLSFPPSIPPPPPPV